MAKRNKVLTTLLKLIISVALVYFIFSKIDLSAILFNLKRSNPYFLLLALGFFTLSKLISAFRLNLYFHNIGVLLTQKSNLQLYFLGMFYNLFLPGGIGGDAYKGYLIRKRFQVSTKKVVSVLVLDRLSGLTLLFLYACFLLALLENENLESIRFLFILAIPFTVTFFWLLNKYFFSYVLNVFWKSLAYSALIQIAQLVAVWCIMKALGIELNQIAYLLIFLISSIVSVLPITIGGIGSREVAFFYGATFLKLNENISVSISVIFFLITAVISLIGIWYHFKKISLKVKELSK